MKKSLYLECFSGISGDMSVSSLIDLGADVNVLLDGLKSLNVEGYEIKISRMKKCGIDACHFDVILDSEKHSHKHHEHAHEHHDHSHEHHDHSYEHHDHSHEHHDHSHEHHEHAHEHHAHEHHAHDHHHHDHRNLTDIVKIIDNSTISNRAKEISKKIFDFVADAEAKAHALPKNEVHFHEVGAVDSIVDIVAVAICIDNLDIHDVYVSTLYEGQGYVKCQHGVIPVPVPAVTNIASVSGLSIRITDNRGEMITPTGIAIAAALKNNDKLPESYKISKIGIGCGKKDFKNANILRAMLIESDESMSDDVYVLESNIDDSTGEALAFTMEKLIENGANDAFFTPIFMKKNRPATMLSVICKANKITAMEDIIFSNLTTIGIRKYKCERSVLSREMKKITTTFGECTVKVCKHNEKTYVYPEYEDVKAICLAKNLDFDAVYSTIKYEGNLSV